MTTKLEQLHTAIAMLCRDDNPGIRAIGFRVNAMVEACALLEAKRYIGGALDALAAVTDNTYGLEEVEALL
jgi:hypothetical protein